MIQQFEQIMSPPQAQAEVIVNESLEALQHIAVYGYKAATSSGLTWGYYGGAWNGFTVSTGTLALTASSTNYIVAARATGVISVSTSNTNWNDTTNYARVYQVVTGASAATTITDGRLGPSGVLATGSGGGSFTGGTLTSPLNEAPQVTLASAATVNIGAAGANSISISGTTTITAFDTIASGAIRRLVFQGALTFTHNATSLILPGGASITTAAGDVAWMESLGSGNWRCVGYHKANGQAVAGGGGGSLANWTEAVATAAPNAAVPVASFTATNAATDVDAVVAPKGAGALLGRVPDNTTTGGNKRGSRAVDWQTERSAAAQVASGTNAVIGGGRSNTSLQNYGTVAGGDGNAANGAGTRSAIGGGGGNTASGSYGSIPGGLNCTVSANYTHAFGSTCTASADYANAGGFTCTADGVGSRVFGQFAVARGLRGADAFAAGRRSGNGDAQRRTAVLFRTTADATTTALTADGSTPSTANQLNLPGALAFKVRGQVIGMRSNGDVSAWDVSFIAKRVGTTTSIVGTPTITNLGSDGTATGYTLAIAADDTNDVIQINVTGTAGHTVYWVAELTSLEVG